jgi:serine/threonine protein kinase
MMEDLIGKKLGPYQLVASLGKGGMGVVYKAYDTKLARYVALKVLPPRHAIDPTFVSRFWQEAKAAANLEHPHIIPVYAYGEHDNYHYIVMQLVREGSLALLLHGQPLLVEQIRHIITQVSGALDYAHSREVIHRDVKPDNILISRRSGCLLTDFGIAKLLESTIHLTGTGVSVGTPIYMSPEQIRGDEDLDGRTDIYSLGVVLYEMATGRPPFQGKTAQAIQMKHLYEPPPPPRSLNPALTQVMVDVILKALAKKREERFATAGEMAQAVQATIPHISVADDERGVAILGPASSEAGVEDQESEAVQPIGEEELTAILEATSVMAPIEEAQPRAAETDRGTSRKAAQEVTSLPDIPDTQPPREVQDQAQAPPAPFINNLRKVPWVGWAAALVVAAVMVGIILLGRTGQYPASTSTSPTVVAVVAETETPTATSAIYPTQTPVPQPTPTHTPAPTPTIAAGSEPAPANIPTPTLQPTPAGTATPEPSPTDTPQATPRPLPDLGGRLAIPLMYGNEPKVYIVSTNGELQNTVGAARQPDYSRDGTKLIVNGDGGTWDKLRVLDPIGGAPFEIGDPALAGHSYPSWSSDGTRIIYEDGTIDPVGWRIFIRDLNTNGPGTGPGTILKAGVGRGELIGRNPLWTTQDRFIFRGCNTWEIGQESDCGIWVMKGNGGTPTKLTSNPNHIPTDVDGDTVVYVSAEKGDWNVYMLNIVNGQTQQMTFDNAADGLPTIAPDGRSIAYISMRQDGLSVWAVSIDGGAPQKLFDIPADWGGLSPDGWYEEKLSWGRTD